MTSRYFTLGFFLYLLLLPLLLPAQEELLLEKPPFKRIQIQPGDSIRLRTGQFTFARQFVKIKDSMLVTRLDSLPIASIEEISISRSQLSRHWLSEIGQFCVRVQLFYPVMVLINRPLREWRRKHYIQTGAVLVAGIAGSRVTAKVGWKKYKLWKGKWFLNHRLPVEQSVVPN